MRKTYQVLAYVLAAEVIIQAMAIALALAGLGHWVESDGGVLDKKAFDAEPTFDGSVGFPIHGINGEMLIPLLALILLVVSFFAGVARGTRRALLLIGLIVLQVILGISLDDVPYLAPLHVLNAFGILAVAFLAGRSARAPQEATT